jgi:hypothetical protein
MTKTYKEIVYSILESVYKYRITDDHDISVDWIKKKVVDINLRMVEEAYKKGESLDSYYQKSCCIEVKCNRLSCTIDGETVESGDVEWYSEISALNPKIGYRNIAFLGTSDMKREFRRVSYSGFVSSGSLDWVHGTTYTVIGNKILFKDLPETGTKMICMVRINADPTSVCDWNEDTPFPTPDPYKLELMVKQDIFSSFNIPLKDEEQDSRDSIAEAQGKIETQQQPQ